MALRSRCATQVRPALVQLLPACLTHATLLAPLNNTPAEGTQTRAIRAVVAAGVASPAYPNSSGDKLELVSRLLAAKEATGLTFSEIAQRLGLTNTYTAQLLYNQAQLKPGTAKELAELIPGISKADLATMQRAPMRDYDETILQEPLVYRLNEAVNHYGDGLKAIVNEEFGDGIMSAIDFFMRVEKVKGSQGEDRVVITFNGKFLPHVEQRLDNDTSK